LHLNMKNKQGHRLEEEKETCDVQLWKVSEMPLLTKNENVWFW
jgi:hypothetical protein